MSRNSILIDASPDAIFDVLEDAYAYPKWVVGTRRIRGVDPEWPAVGSRFHHAVGNFVAELHDSTKILERRRAQFIELEVRFRPTGVAQVRVSLASATDGTRVTIEETPTGGPVQRLPRGVTDPLLGVRNALSLRRFRRLVRARARAPVPALAAD